MSQRVIIVGAGHNGLVAGALLAAAGRQVEIIEARDVVGGLAARETFAEGFSTVGLLHDASRLRPSVVKELGLSLERRPRPTVCAPDGAGGLLRIGDTLEGATPTDASGLVAFRRFVNEVRGVIEQLMDSPAIDPRGSLWSLFRTGWAVRRLGADRMIHLLQVAPKAVSDWMRDEFASEPVMAAIAQPALDGLFTGPWSSHTATNLLVRECLSNDEVVGGPAAVVDALIAAAKAKGATIRLGERVATINVEGDRVTGVTLASGEERKASAVVSTLSPRQTIVGLVGHVAAPHKLVAASRTWRVRGTTAKLDLALSTAPSTSAGAPVEELRSGTSLAELEKAFDAAKHRRVPDRPAVIARFFTGQSAPQGKATGSVLIHAAPYTIDGGWTDDARETLLARTLAVLNESLPGLSDTIEAHRLLVPTDIESQYGVDGGHIHHGEHAPDQLLFMRPSIDCGHHATPIEGLYLGGSSTHPGGGLTGGPGRLAAHAVLKR